MYEPIFRAGAGYHSSESLVQRRKVAELAAELAYPDQGFRGCSVQGRWETVNLRYDADEHVALRSNTLEKEEYIDRVGFGLVVSIGQVGLLCQMDAWRQ